ncbi:hypothetical protein BDZ45DRAFT_704971 [Acephala macrosclerotiorum]|nr:hypothetical protein BDZ45DRAFT_704971 [Acephala macrosclerotiorum]
MSIQFAVGNRDSAPFVGHDVFLQDDFDISLRMQMNNFIVRLATYHSSFKKGVSLTLYNELARWEKGPFTKLFMRFWSDIKITSKITILAYIGTYYAIAAAVPLTLANYLIVDWFSSEIFVGVAVVFNILSPLAFAMLHHSLGEKVFFLEVEKQGFRVGLDKIFRDFKFMYMFCVSVIGGMVYLGTTALRGWTITDFAAIMPLANQIGCPFIDEGIVTSHLPLSEVAVGHQNPIEMSSAYSEAEAYSFSVSRALRLIRS